MVGHNVLEASARQYLVCRPDTDTIKDVGGLMGTQLIHGLVLAVGLFLSASAQANLKAHVAQLPVLAESKDKGVLVDLVKALGKVYDGGKIDLEVLAFNQSMNGTLRGQADFHLPLLKDPAAGPQGKGFRYSNESLWNVKFALYTNKSSKLTPATIQGANVETEITHTHFFSGVSPSKDIVESLKKVNDGKLDGFIFAALESDEIIKREKLANLQSHHFKTFEVKFIVPNGKKGEATAKTLSELIAKAKANGDFDRILAPIVSFYSAWQPTAK